MKYLGFQDMIDLAIKQFEIDIPSDIEEQDKLRDKIRKKLLYTSHNYPINGPSFYERALSDGGQTSPRLFAFSDVQQIMLLCEDYLSRFSQNPYNSNINKLRKLRAEAAQFKEKLEEIPSEEERTRQFFEDVKSGLSEWFILEHGYDNFDENSEDFKRYYAEHYYDYLRYQEYERIQDEEWRKNHQGPPITLWEPPVPISPEELEIFIHDKRYGLIKEGFYNQPGRPEISTGIYLRSREPAEKMAEKRIKSIMLQYLFDLFFEVDRDLLIEDYFFTVGIEEEQKDADYFIRKDRLKDMNNYIIARDRFREVAPQNSSFLSEEINKEPKKKKRYTKAEKKDFERTISDLKDKIKILEKENKQLAYEKNVLQVDNQRIMKELREETS